MPPLLCPVAVLLMLQMCLQLLMTRPWPLKWGLPNLLLLPAVSHAPPSLPLKPALHMQSVRLPLPDADDAFDGQALQVDCEVAPAQGE